MKNQHHSPCIIFLFLFCLISAAAADVHQGVGVGFIFGAPTGLSAKKWCAPQQAFDAAAAWSTGEQKSFYFHADYLYQQPQALPVHSLFMDWHYGFGGMIRFDDRTVLGIRLPFGLDYGFKTIPVEIFAEIVPVVLLAPGTGFDIDGGIGIRLFL